jgi:hypothetical protein
VSTASDPRVGHNGGPPLEITGQTIFRVVNPNKAYTKLSNVLLGDTTISFECKGFLVSILMLPVDWAFHVNWLRSKFGVGKDKAYDLVKEAIEHRYCRRVHVRRKGGTVARVEYHFTDDPTDMKAPDDQLPETPEVAPVEQLPETPEVACALATSGNDHFRQRPLPASATSGKAGHIQRKQSHKGLKDTNSPPTPRSRKGSRRERERNLVLEILDDLSQDAICAPVERILLRPVLTTGRRFDPDCVDLRRALTEFALWASRCSPAVLGNAAHALKAERDRKVFAANLEKAVKAAADIAGEPIVGSLPGVQYSTGRITISKVDTPRQYEAWLQFYGAEQAARRPNKVTLMAAHGFTVEQSEWPPEAVEAGA